MKPRWGQRGLRSRRVTEGSGVSECRELTGIRTGKPATETEPRSELTARGYLELVAVSVSLEPGRRPG